MSLVNRRLARLERRLRTSATSPIENAALLLPDGQVGDGWEEVPDLVSEAPPGWMYVRRAAPDTGP